MRCFIAKKTKNNFYVVRKGYDLKNKKIVTNQTFKTWDEAKVFVIGISFKKHGVTPEYAGFVTKEEADSYLTCISKYKYEITKSKQLEEDYYAIRTGFDKETGEIIENQIIKGWSNAREYLEDITLEKHGIQIEFEKFSKRSKALTYILEKFPDANRIKLKIS